MIIHKFLRSVARGGLNWFAHCFIVMLNSFVQLLLHKVVRPWKVALDKFQAFTAGIKRPRASSLHFYRTVRHFLIRTLRTRGRYSARKIQSMSRPSHDRRVDEVRPF
jgi:hypothetical protein